MGGQDSLLKPPPLRLAWGVWSLGALFYLFAFFQRVAPAVMTDRLMAEFVIGGAALGNLSALYFQAYVVMQIPTGLMADRWGPRRVLTAGAAVAAIGSLIFAMAPSYFWAGGGRLLIGAAVAVGFVSTLKLAAHWLPPQRYALASGMTLFFGVSGGMIAGAPLRLLVEAWGWREMMAVAGVFSLLLAAAVWRLLRDDPQQLGYASYHPHEDKAAAPVGVWSSLAAVLSQRNVWLLMLAPVGFSGAALTFAGLWGVPWLQQIHGLDAASAAAVASTLLAAWALGGPLLGAWSQRLGRRKPLYLISGALAAVGWAAVIFLPLPLWLTIILLVAIGFASGNIIIGFAWARESLPAHLMGAASGVVNMGPLLGGVLLQPGVGWLLDRGWDGVSIAGARVYDAAAWRDGFSLMFAVVVLALMLIPFARESYCRQA